MQAFSAVRGRGGVWLGLARVIVKDAEGKGGGVTTAPGYFQGFVKLESTFYKAVRRETNEWFMFIGLVS